MRVPTSSWLRLPHRGNSMFNMVSINLPWKYTSWCLSITKDIMFQFNMSFQHGGNTSPWTSIQAFHFTFQPSDLTSLGIYQYIHIFIFIQPSGIILTRDLTTYSHNTIIQPSGIILTRDLTTYHF